MTPVEAITERVHTFLKEIPSGVTVMAAAKTRSPEEIQAAIAGGIRALGANYVQEARTQIASLQALDGRDALPDAESALSSRESTELPRSDRVSPLPNGQALIQPQWEMIGHLQRNKAKDAVRLFDRIQTVDSLRLATAIERECAKIGRVMPVLIEVNCAREPQKSGVYPEAVPELVASFASEGFAHVRIEGLMTMGPLAPDPEQIRPHFAATRHLFEMLAAEPLENVAMTTLSMGMSNSYQVAIEEGSTMIRVGTSLFGPRAR